MNLKSEIIKEHSKYNTERVAGFIGNNPELLDELTGIVLKEENDTARKAAWVMRMCYENNTHCLDKYISKLVHHLSKDQIHTAVRRNILGILITACIPEKDWGILIDHCFKFLLSGQETISVKAFSMDIIQRYAINEPSLYNELCLVLEDQYPFGSAGFKSKARKVLQGNKKINRNK
jgi:hypothetical protein